MEEKFYTVLGILNGRFFLAVYPDDISAYTIAKWMERVGMESYSISQLYGKPPYYGQGWIGVN